MKFFYFILILLAVTSNVSARENPFEPTKTYQEELARMMEIEEDYSAEFQEKNDSHYEQMSEIKPKVEPKKAEATQPKKEEVVKPTVVKPKIPDENLVYVPLREQTHTKEAVIAIIPGVEVSFEGKKLQIKSKYEVFQKFDVNKENKIILDFRATTSFYTIRKDLNSQYFNKLTVGNHQKEKFFRMALELPASPKDYVVTYDKDMVTVLFEESSLK